jgi:Ca-activated chloride channel family protein
MSQDMRLCVLAVLALASTAHAADLPGHMGMYPPQGAPLAMLDSDIDVTVRGPIVEATVTQTFRNDTDRPTEATYIFPLPPDAAVSAMAIHTGTRTIHASIEKRERAAERYERAIAAGLPAALLDEERPDVFTQTVAAIPAHGVVQVTLRYDTTARRASGQWELALPLVVAPRYVPGSATGRPTTGAGRSPDTDRAPDASRITPASAPDAGGKTAIHLHFASEVTDLASPTHMLEGDELVDPHSDHDVVIRWRAKVPDAAWVEQDADGGYAAIVVEAPASKPRATPLHVLLVLDRSATTRGDGDTTEHPFIHALLDTMTTADRIAVAGSDDISARTPADVRRTLDDRWSRAAGPFDLSRALAGLHTHDPVILVTDGLVANDAEVLAAARRAVTPVHVIGIGPAPNRSLLMRIASVTGGTVRFAAPGDSLPELARDVLADAAQPPEPLAVTWGTLGATDVVPGQMPRLGAHQAALVLARVKKAVASNARVQGDVFGFVAVTAPHAPEGATTAYGPLARRWAREKLDDLVAAGDARAIVAHAIRYGLVSPQTSMVAIGDDVIVQGGVKHTTPVPVSVPAGMKWQLVEPATHVDTTSSKLDEEQTEAKKRPKTEARDDDEEDADKNVAAAGATETGADEAPAPMSPEMSRADVAEEAVMVTGLAPYRHRRLSFAAGTGISVVNGNADVTGQLVARYERAAGKSLVGAEGSLWLVGGVHAEGSLLAIGSRGITRHLELGLGGGVHLTGNGVGPALDLALRIPLTRSLRLFLRYDGALLLHDGTMDGQNAASAGIETTW